MQRDIVGSLAPTLDLINNKTDAECVRDRRDSNCFALRPHAAQQRRRPVVCQPVLHSLLMTAGSRDDNPPPPQPRYRHHQNRATTCRHRRCRDTSRIAVVMTVFRYKQYDMWSNAANILSGRGTDPFLQKDLVIFTILGQCSAVQLLVVVVVVVVVAVCCCC